MKAFITLIAAFAAGPALADAPLLPPERFTACSPRAESLYRFGSSRQFNAGNATGIGPGCLADTRRASRVVPVGRWGSVVVGCEGMNLVPADVTLSEPVLHFYNRGRLVRTATLDQLYRRTMA
ncbi:hypothetical protein I5U82_01080 [Stenotrophomonas maltophilia]|nr:hypothetical protein [Stenotrophomonas maltophilia]